MVRARTCSVERHLNVILISLADCLKEIQRGTDNDDTTAEAISYCDTMITEVHNLRMILTAIERGDQVSELKNPLA
jgi:hypothetical protein